ncbi:MAG TPA: DUF3617 family protein [Thermoanaerobaculia bacterium]
MKNFARCLVAVAALAVVLPMTAAEHPQKPGKWQVKMEMEMPGMPVKVPPMTIDICLTEEDLKDPEKSLPKDPKSDCKVNDYKIDGNTVSWKMECPKEKVKGEGKITFTDTTYNGTMSMQMGEQAMKTKYSGKWMGACTK